MSKPKLFIHVDSASHFLSWELPYFARYFDLANSPGNDTIVFAFGPDVFESAILLPAKMRVALLFPGFGLNPYHNLVHKYGMRHIIEKHYDLVFANPGPTAAAFEDCIKLRLCSFSVNTDLIKFQKSRTGLNALIHISNRHFQKDWTRSRDIMRMTGLRYEVFPHPVRFRLNWARQRLLRRLFNRKMYHVPGYIAHSVLARKYQQNDGFVHVAAEKPPVVDGKYTATLLEAGLTGCLLFWHDTLGMGNDFETVFDLPLDPRKAADEILQIRKSVNVPIHSRRTAEEIYEYVNPDRVMKTRFEAIKEFLNG